ncbi:MAG: hypothetical protein V7785_22020 [Bermanella sp.]
MLEPWGHKAENRRMGVVTATLANFVGQLSDHNALTPTDIFPDRQTIEANKTPSLNSMKQLGDALKSINGN